jgi:hypothetical protein
MLLDEAADAIETFEARQKTAMQFDDPGGTLVWSPAEMVDLLQEMAQSADRRTLSLLKASTSCPVMRTRFPALRTLQRTAGPYSWVICARISSSACCSSSGRFSALQ